VHRFSYFSDKLKLGEWFSSIELVYDSTNEGGEVSGSSTGHQLPCRVGSHQRHQLQGSQPSLRDFIFANQSCDLKKRNMISSCQVPQPSGSDLDTRVQQKLVTSQAMAEGFKSSNQGGSKRGQQQQGSQTSIRAFFSDNQSCDLNQSNTISSLPVPPSQWSGLINDTPDMLQSQGHQTGAVDGGSTVKIK